MHRQANPQQQNQHDDQANPDNPGKDPKTGKQLTNPKKPRNKQGKKFDRAKVEEAWGELPPYLQEIFKKGGSPAVPSKYKNFEVEFHKKADRKKRKK